ncbi:alpha-hydroxy-acid oxidizing enzyme [Zoogloeaceae bacteirum Par-f-2]|nr:alpha-hydroxy-acid oxidizing enzyme [Zoogloeaceae bacteirum Par-f-2]
MSTVTPPLEAIPYDIVSASDYEQRARAHLDDNAWAYLQGAAADELTLAANVDAFRRRRLLPRVLRDLRQGHTRCRLFDDELEHPLLLAPLAYQRLFHPDGELASALAAGVMGSAMVVSTLATYTLEDIASQARGPLWFQLYWQGERERSLALVRRAEAAGYRALVVTVDAPVSGVRNREQRAGFRLPPGIVAANVATTMGHGKGLEPRGIFAGLMAVAPTWDDIAWLRSQTRLPLLLKGILHVDDGRLARELGVDGIVVSNHGGRVLDTTPASLDLLPAFRATLGERFTLLVDGGIRRGSDVFKAIACGADAVMIGRPYAHALAVAGALGVAHLLKLLRQELEACMALCGCADLAAINAGYLCSD